ncbi:MAG: flagellar type III secretion system pore protein FliP [Planctomycetes bacterium]|nr:flagellar type III secretion system pore protein FliP [Planctomycetota bacterium]
MSWIVVVGAVLVPGLLSAQGLQDFDPLSRDNLSVSLKMLSILTLLTLAPTILLLTTAFPRIVIVLGFVRRALSTQEVPPNQVIIGLALILTFFVMGPTLNRIKNEALLPYLDGMPDAEALEIGVSHLRDFMWRQTDPDSLDVMIELSTDAEVDAAEEMTLDQVPLFTLVPAFLLSELKRAFEMGFMIYLPFVVIDLVVASTLISMGMLVLPPVLISLPFKILVFVLVDGWEIIVTQLVASF